MQSKIFLTFLCVTFASGENGLYLLVYIVDAAVGSIQTVALLPGMI